MNDDDDDDVREKEGNEILGGTVGTVGGKVKWGKNSLVSKEKKRRQLSR